MYWLGSPVATHLEHRGWMKQLCSSSDLRELTELVKRLVSLAIPCAVCKDSGDSRLSVWVQQDRDFPLALKIFADRDKPRPLPPWACLLDSPAPAARAGAVPATQEFAVPATAENDGPCVVVMQSRGPTVTQTAEATAQGWGARPRRTRRRGLGRRWGPRPPGS